MFFKIYILASYLCLFMISSVQKSVRANGLVETNLSAINQQILIPINVTRCNMYSNDCKILILISNEIQITDLKASINETKCFTFIKFESCDNIISNTKLTANEDCNKTNVTALIPKKIQIDNYKIVYAFFKPIIIGKSFIRFSNNQTDIGMVNMIILQPKRLIDSIFDKFVLVFQLMISTFMGLLLDVNTISKIIKMPIPVLIGFLSQYICMPLVFIIFFNLFFDQT